MRAAARFAYAGRRQDAFAKFLDDRVGRRLCVVVDGRLADEATISRGMAAFLDRTGLLEERETGLCALLRYGPLPCRLVPER